MAGTKGTNGSDAVAYASGPPRAGGRWGARDLPDPANVAVLLDIRRRPWPPGGGALSFSMRGLWRCYATEASFDAWFRGKASRGLCVRGVHYVPGKGDDGSNDFFVAVPFGMADASSTTTPGVEAARLIASAFLDLVPDRGRDLSRDPPTAALAERAAVEVSCPPAS